MTIAYQQRYSLGYMPNRHNNYGGMESIDRACTEKVKTARIIGGMESIDRACTDKVKTARIRYKL